MKKAFIVFVLGALVAQAPALAQAPAVRAARQSRVTPDMVLRKFYEVMSVTQSPEDEKEARKWCAAGLTEITYEQRTAMLRESQSLIDANKTKEAEQLMRRWEIVDKTTNVMAAAICSSISPR
jgi:hypothetical protein